MTELLSYVEYKKGDKLKSWGYSNTFIINETLKYIDRHSENNEIHRFITDFISDLRAQINGSVIIVKDSDALLLRDTIKKLKTKYLDTNSENELFGNNINESYFNHCLDYFKNKRALKKIDIVYFYHLFKHKFLREKQKLYSEYVNEYYIKNSLVDSQNFNGKVPSITTLYRNGNSLEKRNKLFKEAQEKWNESNQYQMRFNGIDVK